MADIATFPTIQKVLITVDNMHSYTAGAALKAGQVVAIHGTGVSKTVHPAVKGTTAFPLGVNLYAVASGGLANVAENGCHVIVANADDTTTIDAGHPVEDNDNAVGGTVSELDFSGSGATATAKYQVGILIEDMAGNSTAEMIVQCGIVTQPNSS